MASLINMLVNDAVFIPVKYLGNCQKIRIFVLMIDTIRHIEYLLTRHDCVIVPGFGAFMRQHHAAAIDMQTGLVSSPHTSLSFNSDISHNDGLLCNSISRRNNISYEDAVNLVEHEVSAMRSMLNVLGEISLGHIGSIKKRHNGLLEFNLNERVDFNPSTSALSDMSMPSNDIDSSLKIVRRRGIDSPAFRIVSIAASIMLILAIGWNIARPIDMGNALKASLQLISVGEPTATCETTEKYPDLILSIAQPDPKSSTAINHPALASSKSKYYIVIASLASNKEANEYLSTNHFDNVCLTVVDGGSRHRVTIDEGNDLNELSADLIQWRKTFPTAWIYQCK